MESFAWSMRTLDVFRAVVPFFFLHLFLTFTLERPDYISLLAAWLWKRATGRTPGSEKATAPCGTGLVVIPSLLRDDEDFNAITTTIASCATNDYPSELVIVAAVDGRTEHPKLYAALRSWVAAQSFAANVAVHTTGTDKRLGKMMAVESGVTYTKDLVAQGELAAIPQIYFSIDGDGTLGPHALERLATRLSTRNRFTKNPLRIVSGKLAIRPDLIWRGWRAFFTVEGQLYTQVAREFVVSNMMRFNRKLTPQIGVPGALYCCWSDLLLMAPHYMGFMKTVRYSQWLKWWFGAAPPSFTNGTWPSMPEALTGASDDTCMAFLASMATWKDGKLSLEAPRTPLHSFARLVRSFFIERSHSYEPEARIYTFTPSTIKGLWVQRVRWNSSRFECTGRFWRAFWFHWEIGFPTTLHLSLVLHQVARVFVYYIVVPFCLVSRGHIGLGFFYGYMFHIVEDLIYTAFAFSMERDYRRCWRSILSIPLSPLYTIVYSNAACAYGVVKDLLLFGNPTKFAPEWTLVAGRTSRVAIMYRVRRFMALTLRAAVYGDVPFGAFWFGWLDTKWTPNGFEGWTTGKKPRAVFELPWSRRARVNALDLAVTAAPTPSPAVDAAPRISMAPSSRRPSLASSAYRPASTTVAAETGKYAA